MSTVERVSSIIRNNLRTVIGTLIAVLIVLVSLWAINVQMWPQWTGFNGKTVWDLLELLIIPLTLTGLTILFNRQRARTEQQIAADKQHEEVLQNYLDRISTLRLHERLLQTRTGEEVQVVARRQTMITLRRLDTARKGVVIQFLNESSLISNPRGIITLYGADLRGVDLSWTTLDGTFLRGAILPRANLYNASLARADLYGARLDGADLRNVDLQEANLDWAFLAGAN